MLWEWSSCVPWEKLRRAMSMPRRSSSRMAASLLLAGPMVQMILARRRAELCTPSAADACVSFNLSRTRIGVSVGYNIHFKSFEIRAKADIASSRIRFSIERAIRSFS